MRVLVTGSSGFIGKHVVKYLLENTKCEVVASSCNAEKAKTMSWYNDVQYIPYDFRTKKDGLFDYFYKPDVVINLAWDDYKKVSSLHHLETSFFDQYCFMTELVNGGVENIVGVGSCFEYGLLEGCLSEAVCCSPITPYAVAKDSLARFISHHAEKMNSNFKWIRPFYLYGEGQHPQSIFGQLDTAMANGDSSFNMSGGEQLRDYLPINIAARNIVEISFQPHVNGAINCCSGQPVSIRAKVEEYIKERNSSLYLNLGYYDYSKNEPMAAWGCSLKMLKALEPVL